MTFDECHIEIREKALKEGKQIVIDYIENNFWNSEQFGNYIINITKEELEQMKDELEMGSLIEEKE